MKKILTAVANLLYIIALFFYFDFTFWRWGLSASFVLVLLLSLAFRYIRFEQTFLRSFLLAVLVSASALPVGLVLLFTSSNDSSFFVVILLALNFVDQILAWSAPLILINTLLFHWLSKTPNLKSSGKRELLWSCFLGVWGIISVVGLWGNRPEEKGAVEPDYQCETTEHLVLEVDQILNQKIGSTRKLKPCDAPLTFQHSKFSMKIPAGWDGMFFRTDWTADKVEKPAFDINQKNVSVLIKPKDMSNCDFMLKVYEVKVPADLFLQYFEPMEKPKTERMNGYEWLHLADDKNVKGLIRQAWLWNGETFGATVIYDHEPLARECIVALDSVMASLKFKSGS